VNQNIFAKGAGQGFSDLPVGQPGEYRRKEIVRATATKRAVEASLAQQMGYTVENSGVSVQLSNPYLPSTARSQALAAADAAGIYVVFDDDNGVMALVPKNGARSGTAPVISPMGTKLASARCVH
jgi:hypothetical protein